MRRGLVNALLRHPAAQQPKPQPKPTAAPLRGNRHQRRAQALFNRKLAERQKKDGTPAKIEVLPDGGVHATVDMREDKKVIEVKEEELVRGEELEKRLEEMGCGVDDCHEHDE